MKKRLLLFLATALAGWAVQGVHAKDLADLKVLYIGAERPGEFKSFLRQNVGSVTVVDRRQFKPEAAAPFDVVLLDWPQTGQSGDFPPRSSPLGAREQWTKPTVLIGSAGLNLAVVWKLKGGAGCTCMDPWPTGRARMKSLSAPSRSP
jgi:hypothetical protein